MNAPAVKTANFNEALRQQRAQNNAAAPNTPELGEWLQYWNDAESFAVNMRNLKHWINCARTHSA